MYCNTEYTILLFQSYHASFLDLQENLSSYCCGSRRQNNLHRSCLLGCQTFLVAGNPKRETESDGTLTFSTFQTFFFAMGFGVGGTMKNHNNCWDWCYWYNPWYLVQELIILFLLKNLNILNN